MIFPQRRVNPINKSFQLRNFLMSSQCLRLVILIRGFRQIMQLVNGRIVVLIFHLRNLFLVVDLIDKSLQFYHDLLLLVSVLKGECFGKAVGLCCGKGGRFLEQTLGLLLGEFVIGLGEWMLGFLGDLGDKICVDSLLSFAWSIEVDDTAVWREPLCTR